VGAFELRQETAHLGWRHVLQPQRKAPVFEPWLEHMMIQLLCVLRELDRVAGAISVEGAKQRLIAAAAGKRRRGGQVKRYTHSQYFLKNHRSKDSTQVDAAVLKT